MNYTILVNKNNKIKANYLNKVKLITTKDQDNKDVEVEEETFKAFKALQAYLLTENIHIAIDSSYRSIADQEKIYNDFLNSNGKEYVTKYVALPGMSEHHTGLAIDLSLIVDGKMLEEKTNPKLYQALYEKVHENLKDFGFILRYPKDKEPITGYQYEPWHIRYVGSFISKIIYENNYTLEEYLTKFSGILVINKPKNLTSFDVVNEISHLFGIKKIGHTGTLDPIATGVLVVTIGQATKVVELLTASYKEYVAEAILGVDTDTLDITGNILQTKEYSNDIDMKTVIQSFEKTYYQEVPIYSAIKVNGKKLYDYARNNEKVTLPKKDVTIKEISLLNKNLPYFTFKCLVSKGCYIRSLIRDIAKSIDNFATMSNLTRTKQGKFTLEMSSTLEELKSGKYHIYKIEEALDYPVLIADEVLEKRIKHGEKLINTYNITDKVIFLNRSNCLLGIYENKDGILKVWKNFN